MISLLSCILVITKGLFFHWTVFCIVKCFEAHGSVFALVLMCIIWILNESWSTMIPWDCVSCWMVWRVLWHLIEVIVFAAVDLRECFLNINSNDLFSMILIPHLQKGIIWSMECCRLDWIFGRLDNASELW